MADDLLERPEAISYEKLYRRWEQGNWSATAIDFSVDAEHWNDRLTDLQRESALWNYAMFLVGEEAVARTLTPVLDAAPTHAHSAFLATQIVDEARHHVFFDRFMREVAGQGADIESTLETVRSRCTWGFNEVFSELDRLSEALHKRRKDRALLTQMVALYHVVVEGVLAIPGQHFIQRYVEKLGIMPGFSAGITNVSRDEARHVAFGVKFLKELVNSSRECRAAAIELWDRALYWAVGVFIPPNWDEGYVTCFDFTLEEIYAFAMRSLETKMNRVGIGPTEVRRLALQDPELTFEERAAQLLVLMRDGVLGDDRREPDVTAQSVEILFEGMRRSTNMEVARSLEGAIEFAFTDAEPWHLVVTNGHIEAKPGRAGDPALTLEIGTSDWAKIAVGRFDPRWALLKRKMRVHGHLSAKAKLPKLFEYR